MPLHPYLFLWDFNSPDIFCKACNMQSIQQNIALRIVCFPVQILEGSDGIMVYMTCCSQVSGVSLKESLKDAEQTWYSCLQETRFQSVLAISLLKF